MSKPNAAIHINLIPEETFFVTPLGRLVKWSLSVGRYLVIFTEIIVIISFASRFSLDRKLTDLNKEISQKLAIVESYSSFEDDFRATQEKLKQYAELEKQRNLTIVFEYLSAVTPNEVQINNLIVRKESIMVSGTTASQNAFNTLINNLYLSPRFDDVSVSKVTANDDNSGYEFQFIAKTINE